MESFGKAYSALIIGGSGGIGSAFYHALSADEGCVSLHRIDREATPIFELRSPKAILQTIEQYIPGHLSFDLIIDATGALEINGARPERSIDELEFDNMRAHFETNAIGPALLMQKLFKRMREGQRAIYAKLGARVGSIEDNALGGWISYRASKAALNQIIKTSAIELQRKSQDHILVGLHPGTVSTSLSENYNAKGKKITPEKSVELLLKVIDQLEQDQTGYQFDYRGTKIPG